MVHDGEVASLPSSINWGTRDELDEFEKAYAKAARTFYGDPAAEWRGINTRQKRWDISSGPPDRND